MSEIKILLANEGDAVALAELSYSVGKMHDEAMPEYFKPTARGEHFRIICEMLNDLEIRIFKAVCEGKICGFLCLLTPAKPRNGFIHVRTGVILNFGVDEAYRKLGIGTQLIQYAERFLLSKGIDAMELDVFIFNENARKLYEKMRYKVTEQHMFKSLN
ncbi:MAG: GNAT family N-acetyltransferase [Acetobacter sp.]|nr:GNAT family N-acetyltransferase [Acetobacter sp.]